MSLEATQIKDDTKRILDRHYSHVSLEAIGRLSQNLLKLGDRRLIITSGAQTKGGVAVRGADTHNCLEDQHRTAAFSQALYDAVLKKHAEKRPGQKVKVLYLGSGPFATLALPTALHANVPLEFRLVEVQASLIKNVRSVIEKLNLGAQFPSEKIIEADACEYVIPVDDIPDIVVSETMDKALRNEPLAYIMANVDRQVPESTLFIPRKVDVRANLKLERVASGSSSDVDSYVFLGPIAELTRTRARGIASIEDAMKVDATFVLPSLQGFYELQLGTTVEVDDKRYLDRYPSTGSLISADTVVGVRVGPQDSGKPFRIAYSMGSAGIRAGTLQDFVLRRAF